jgi:hypothetical protein
MARYTVVVSLKSSPIETSAVAVIDVSIVARKSPNSSLELHDQLQLHCNERQQALTQQPQQPNANQPAA